MVRYVALGLLAFGSLATDGQAAGGRGPRRIPDAARAILEKAERIELFSLDPQEPDEVPKDGFHGWRVLGKTAVKQAGARKRLVEALAKGVSQYKGGPAKCFNPRHGIRATRGGKTADFVICFECYQARVVVEGQREQTFLVSRSPTSVFNEILKKAGVSLPKPPGGG
jgi:hypothetical protein